MKAKASKILIVDDQEANREILEELVSVLGHESLFAENGLSALAQIEKNVPDLILLDIMMPVMDGHEVLEQLQADNVLRHIPVIVISALDEMDSVVRCIANGAEDYLVKPFKQEILKARISRSLENKRLRNQEEIFRKQLQEYNLGLEDRVREQVWQITRGHLGTIFAMSKLAESRDPETGEHLERMREYCKILACQLGTISMYASDLDESYIENIYWASPLHDIGKVGIPDHILLKPGKLTDDEFDVIKTHSTIGAETLQAVFKQCPDNDFIRMGIEIAESHHEKWDGSGYPHNLSGRDIPLAGRIVALGDVYDALTSKRCYKDAFSHEKSQEIVLKGRGTHFDPDIVEAFLSSEKKFVSVRERIVDSSRGSSN